MAPSVSGGGNGEHNSDGGASVREALTHVVGYIVGAAGGPFPDDESRERAGGVVGMLFARQPLGLSENGVVRRAKGVIRATSLLQDDQVASRARLVNDLLVEVFPVSRAVADGVFEEPVFLIREDDAAASAERAGGVDGEEVGAAGRGGNERRDAKVTERSLDTLGDGVT